MKKLADCGNSQTNTEPAQEETQSQSTESTGEETPSQSAEVSEQFGYQVNIGVITTPLSEIAALEGSFDVRIELAE